MKEEDMKKHVAGVVVLYNPDGHVLDNIRKYVHDLGRLYVVDNSDKELPDGLGAFLKGTRNVEYIRFGENRGIAHALNEGASRATEAGFDWILTMDQDSGATSGMVRRLYEFVVSGTLSDVGIVAAQPELPRRRELDRCGWTLMPCVIASGNLVNLDAWRRVGGFEDKLFIDCVDTVFCLSLREKGYVLVQMNDVILNHKLGESTVRYFLGIKMIPTHHNHIRKYYIARNRLYMHLKFGKTFPEFMRSDYKGIAKDIIKLILFEERKRLKIKMMLRGIQDCRHGKFGKLEP